MKNSQKFALMTGLVTLSFLPVAAEAMPQKVDEVNQITMAKITTNTLPTVTTTNRIIVTTAPTVTISHQSNTAVVAAVKIDSLLTSVSTQDVEATVNQLSLTSGRAQAVYQTP